MMKKDPVTGAVTVKKDEAPSDATARLGAFVTDHPFATAGAAIAAGAVIGMLLPRWKVGAAAGSTIARTARNAVKAVAAAETARSVLAGITAATGTVRDSVKDGAHRIAEHLPDGATVSSVKATAKRALEQASETAQKAGGKVAETARKTIKAGEDLRG